MSADEACKIKAKYSFGIKLFILLLVLALLISVVALYNTIAG